MHTCDKCQKFGLRFQRQYRPEEYVEGDPRSPVWIIGLNPKKEVGWQDSGRTIDNLKDYFSGRVHSYFRNFREVSERLHNSLGQPGGTAHTDIVKCSSMNWPPSKDKKAGPAIVENCTPYLRQQIDQFKPRMIVCNGADVCRAITRVLPPERELAPGATGYFSSSVDYRVCVVLSGFIGRIDNYARRRLGADIDRLCQELGVWPVKAERSR